MPLSDAAKALLAARSGRGGPPPPKPEPEPEDLDAEEAERRRGFRERARREAERFELATDSEFWLAFCFREPRNPAEFCAAAGVAADDRGYVDGAALTAALGERPARTARDRARAMLASRSLADDATDRMSGIPRPDPLANVVYTGDLATDAAAELIALHAALNAPPDPSPPYLLDSPHWIVAHFPSRDIKEAFLADTGLDALGDKYLDGHQAAKILQLKMKE
ncbi:hypothetical protein [Actinomadura rudentiformis]|uniref:Uncharacterized protein n=1 Tax=Actinomadura rudentiformis TaxID=359158 RepID=A0A6H9YI34_9ACTN|nr:hypothetical protein [Actinomadura rudentiformis]KAB2344867.1 hypothetical protein F8566_30205 [Actinomadura rudentiformis]